MKRIILAGTTALAVVGGVVAVPLASPFAAVASAHTSDQMPMVYAVKKAADADAYLGEVTAFSQVASYRHAYHTATGNEKFDNYYTSTQAQRDAHLWSEQACYAAKARLALATMKMEGNADARALDLSKVGIDLAETQKALPILKAAYEEARSTSWNIDSTDPLANTWKSRSKMFSEGAGRLEELVDEITAGTGVREVSAFTIVDWGVNEKYLQPVLEEHHVAGTDTMKLTVTHTTTEAGLPATATTDGATNLALLESWHGTFPLPAVEEAPAPAPEPDIKPAPDKDTDKKTDQDQSEDTPAAEKPQWLPMVLFGLLSSIATALGLAVHWFFNLR